MLTSENLILFATFLGGMSLFFVVYLIAAPALTARRRIDVEVPQLDELMKLQKVGAAGTRDDDRIQRAIEAFYKSLESEKENSIQRRLVRAGFFSRNALTYFYMVRFGTAAAIFTILLFAINRYVPTVTTAMTFYVAGIIAVLALILPNFILDRMGKRQEEGYRRSFPDFMDMLIVCADAGLSLEASVSRVAKEFLSTHREFGIHLNIMMLEVRAGKRLREALQSFADRLEIEEGRSLATVFKQSEELGASLIQTLRVFSNEMRRSRIIRAEEKANSLPVRMVLPLGVFIFPVMLIVVLMPVMLSLLKMFGSNGPH